MWKPPNIGIHIGTTYKSNTKFELTSNSFGHQDFSTASVRQHCVYDKFCLFYVSSIDSFKVALHFRGTFREIVKKKSSENYKGVSYATTLLSTSLWTFYGTLDPDDGVLIVTVNAVGVASQAVYLVLFLFYASKERKVKYFGLVLLDLLFLGIVIAITLVAFHGSSRRTFIGVLCATFTIAMYAAPLSAVVKSLVLVGLLNIGIPGSVIAATLFALDGNARETFIGAFCAAVTVAMYGAPFSVIVTVVQTKSVEYMPFFLSFFLLLNAGAWFTFGVLLRDYYVIVPNAVGLVSGSAQILIYLSYKRLSHENTIEKMVEEGKNESAKVPTSNPYSEGKMRYRSSSLPVPVQSIDRQYSLKNLTRAPSAYILVP
ncbi:hypothetical protein Pfo_005210 [Paulownia fortunei]|nr:hypothetical protein Pfo_005210 [Paulownia fortunei]